MLRKLQHLEVSLKIIFPKIMCPKEAGMPENFITKTDFSIFSVSFCSKPVVVQYACRSAHAFLPHLPHLTSLMRFDYPPVLLLLPALAA